MKKLCIFDIDGTLFKGAEVSFPAYKKLAEVYGIAEPSKELVTSFFGRTFDFVAEAMGFSQDEQQKKDFIQLIEKLEFESLQQNGTLYDGIYELLKKLHEEGYLIALCSLGVQSYVETVMNKTGISEFVCCVRFDDGTAEKPQMVRSILNELRPDAAVMVGDRHPDIDAAAANGLLTIGCAYGYAPDEISGLPIIAQKPEELYELIKTVLD